MTSLTNFVFSKSNVLSEMLRWICMSTELGADTFNSVRKGTETKSQENVPSSNSCSPGRD